MKQARIKSGLSGTELARKADVSRKTIQRDEGDKVEPTLTALVALAEALGIGVDEYIGLQKAIHKMR